QDRGWRRLINCRWLADRAGSALVALCFAIVAQLRAVLALRDPVNAPDTTMTGTTAPAIGKGQRRCKNK
ncbi:MAG: hypothetical protein V2I97_16060, partial [Desulfococcaceae bacterium]|nr:hypothetical protein [Desulfococcaceae bacterium]